MAWIGWRHFRVGWGTATAGALLLGVLIYETSRAQAEQSPAPSAGKEAKKSGVFAEGRVVAPAGSDIPLAAETGGRIAQLLSA
jgi:hypothetical protein